MGAESASFPLISICPAQDVDLTKEWIVLNVLVSGASPTAKTPRLLSGRREADATFGGVQGVAPAREDELGDQENGLIGGPDVEPSSVTTSMLLSCS